MIKKIISFFILCTTTFTIAAKPLPLSYFAKDAQFRNIKLSPDGKHFAATFPRKDSTALAIINRETMKPVRDFDFGQGEHIEQFYWLNNERVIFTRSIDSQRFAAGRSMGDIYGINIDGSRRGAIFGYDANKSGKISNRKGNDLASARIMHLLPDDPKHILIMSYSFFRRDMDSPTKIIKLNAYTGRKKTVATTPFGNMRVVVNAQGEPVISSGVDIEGKDRMFWFNDGEWNEIAEDEKLSSFEPLFVDQKSENLYLSTHPNNGTQALYQYNMQTKKISKVFQNEKTDIHNLVTKPGEGSVVGVGIMPGNVEYHYLDKEDEFAQLHKSLFEAFEGHDIRITSRTEDMSEIIVMVMSDRNPGDFYLYNPKKKSAEYLLSQKSWLEPQTMVEKKPIAFKARDGKEIYGYLTLPNNAHADTPMVTYVHGGPYGVRDGWHFNFDTTPQMLANNGFAVLQVNYRGSGGYGKEYEEVAYKKRSTLIQHDIIDGTKWAMSLDNISDDKACIMGWSFGGYSAVMSPTIEPDLFKCSIAAAGVYDALEQEKDADYADVRSVSKEAEKVYGSDERLLKDESPITYINNLKIPVFIVHGGKDRRVTPEQAHILRAALEERNMPFEWMFKDNEGHGFADEKNLEEFYARSLEFLNKNLR
ncbi:S9 family peptidase [Aliikangiella marina]|uniref:S9 family peptidase n=1 Tax=Aliikangiella marina TaxID=1712262 RepID=A0A545T9M4_9GAMM|nr:prolyl oligopeptidase family serine peptidase [Aliikangiella marina]TQV73908.1 S9 family peptidase [Aliikangiella marina]